MYALMVLQTTLLNERLIAHVTAKFLLPVMHAMMLLQINLMAE
jgi:hypothetical protein